MKTIAFLRGLDKDDEGVKNEVVAMKNKDTEFKSLPKISITSVCKILITYFLLLCITY